VASAERIKLGISKTKEYKLFKTVPRNKILIINKPWIYYDVGPKSFIVEKSVLTVTPLIMIHGTSGTADCFFYQQLELSSRGYRVISVQFPSYWDIGSWTKGFQGFLSALNFDKIHLFGASLAMYPSQVLSLVLCNSFVDTIPFHQTPTCLRMFRYLPEFYLKKYILESFPQKTEDPTTIDFVVEQLESLNGDDLGSRLTLNCLQSHIKSLPADFDQKIITILDSNDDVVLPQPMRDRLYATFPYAKLALLKSGGDFPYLSCPDVVVMHLQVHLRTNGLMSTPDSRTSSEDTSKRVDISQIDEKYDSAFLPSPSEVAHPGDQPEVQQLSVKEVEWNPRTLTTAEVALLESAHDNTQGHLENEDPYEANPFDTNPFDS